MSRSRRHSPEWMAERRQRALAIPLHLRSARQQYAAALAPGAATWGRKDQRTLRAGWVNLPLCNGPVLHRIFEDATLLDFLGRFEER